MATVKHHTIEHAGRHKIPVPKWPIYFEILQLSIPNTLTMKIVFDNLNERFPSRNLNVSEYYGEFLWKKIPIEMT